MLSYYPSKNISYVAIRLKYYSVRPPEPDFEMETPPSPSNNTGVCPGAPQRSGHLSRVGPNTSVRGIFDELMNATDPPESNPNPNPNFQ